MVRLKPRIVRVFAAHGHRFTAGKSNWPHKHRIWQRKLNSELDGPLGTVLSFHLEHLEYLEAQKHSLQAEIHRYVRSEPFRAKVEALCCFRDVKVLTAVTNLTELGDTRRFKKVPGLMAFAGLIPSERNIGNVRRRGRISKSGSQELRRILVEASWHYRKRVGADLIKNVVAWDITPRWCRSRSKHNIDCIRHTG